MTAEDYPVDCGIETPLEIRRWRPFANWLLAIPHYLLLTVYLIGASLAAIAGFFCILFTGKLPHRIFVFLVQVMRYQWRVTTFAAVMRESYPTFRLAGEGEDPTDDDATFDVVEAEHLSRVAPLYKWLLAVPHYIVVLFLMVTLSFVLLTQWVTIVLTGRWRNSDVRGYIIAVYRWQFRVSAYLLLRDEYPPFSINV
jgi:hypothetical protein